VAGSSRLSKGAAQWFSDPTNEVFPSVVSAEIVVKRALGRLDVVPPQREAHGIAMLICPKFPSCTATFCRMLICQAIVNGFAVLTPDNLVSQYPIRTLW
jgi:PIN domain nuclease of toxin-antitoxin system